MFSDSFGGFEVLVSFSCSLSLLLLEQSLSVPFVAFSDGLLILLLALTSAVVVALFSCMYMVVTEGILTSVSALSDNASLKSHRVALIDFKKKDNM